MEANDYVPAELYLGKKITESVDETEKEFFQTSLDVLRQAQQKLDGLGENVRLELKLCPPPPYPDDDRGTELWVALVATGSKGSVVISSWTNYNRDSGLTIDDIETGRPYQDDC